MALSPKVLCCIDIAVVVPGVVHLCWSHCRRDRLVAHALYWRWYFHALCMVRHPMVRVTLRSVSLRRNSTARRGDACSAACPTSATAQVPCDDESVPNAARTQLAQHLSRLMKASVVQRLWMVSSEVGTCTPSSRPRRLGGAKRSHARNAPPSPRRGSGDGSRHPKLLRRMRGFEHGLISKVVVAQRDSSTAWWMVTMVRSVGAQWISSSACRM